MINKKTGKDIFLVVLSNGVRLISNVLTVFFLPLIFSEQDYGFYKLFLLYISYVGIFQFGFNDGVYLYYAGKNYEDLDKHRFRTYTKNLIIFQSIIALLVIVSSFFFTGDRRFILFFVSLNLVALNLTTYFQFISQVTQRFKEFAVRNIIVTVLNVLLIASFYFLKLSDYKLFLIFTVLINYLLLVWYLITYKDITIGKSNKFKKEKSYILLMFKLGIILMFSNLVVMFFSSIPRQFVEIKYPIEQYPPVFSNFSFAYTLMGFTNVFLSAISLVIYPTLKKSTEKDLKKNYNNLNSIIIVLVYILILAYYPLSYIVKFFLPNYIFSLKIFFILAPGISITSAVTVIIYNYYKALNKVKEFLIIGLINLVLLTLSIYFTYTYVIQEIIYISVATVVTQFIWFLSLDIYLNKEYNNISIRNIVFIVVAAMAFYLTYYIKGLLKGFLVYGATIFLLIFLFYGKKISELYELFIRDRKKNKNKENKDF